MTYKYPATNVGWSLTNAASPLAAKAAINADAVIDPRDYGGKGDTQQASGSGTLITAGSTSLTLSGATFTSNDVGKTIVVPRGGKASHTTTIGNGSATNITITHNLGTMNVTVAASLVAGGAAVTNFTTSKATSNAITLTFTSAPESNSVTCVCTPVGNFVQPLVTTIAARVSDTQITLAAPAQSTVTSTAVISGTTTTTYVSWGTDDTAALKAAIAALPTGGTIQLPPGVWTFGEDLVLNRGTVLRGVGMSQGSGLWGAAAQLRPISADARIFVDDFCHVENLMVNGNSLGRWAFQSGNPYDLTGNSASAWIANKTTFTNVRVMNFTEAAFVLEATQNSYMYHCWVQDTPIGYWFLHGTSIMDLVACFYVGKADGNAAARAVLSASAYDDPRTMEGKRTIADPSYVPWAGVNQGGGRDIRFWGGDIEQGSGKYQIEILDSAPYDHSWQFTGTNLQISSDNANGVALIHLGPNAERTILTLRDCTPLVDVDFVHAEGGHVGISLKQPVMGNSQVLPAKIKLSGTATVSYDEASRTLMHSAFDGGLRDLIGRTDWSVYSSGTPTWSAEKRCMTMTLPGSSSGVWCRMASTSPTGGLPSYAQPGQCVTIRFKLSNATGPVLFRSRLSSGLRTIGTFGNGSHELIYELVGDEKGFAFTSVSGSITADLNYFYVYHEGVGGSYPPSFQTWDGVLKDAAGNEWLEVVRTANAANYLQIANRATGNGPRIIAVGDDTDINIDAETKGLGQFRVNAVPVALNSTTATHTAQQIELGHASDTTITRLSAGKIAVENIEIVRRNVQTVTTATTLGSNGDYVAFISGANGAVTLPTAASNTGKYTLKNTYSSSKTVGTTSNQTINGAAASSFSIAAGATAVLFSDGSNWQTI